MRRLSIDYYRRLAEPDALFFSIRDPDWHKVDFYGDWNPQVMRRLQDKFNFKVRILFFFSLTVKYYIYENS